MQPKYLNMDLNFNTEKFLISNATLYLAKYLLLNNEYEKFNLSLLNHNLNQLYYNKEYFCKAIDYFIENDFLENITFIVEEISSDKKIDLIIDTNSKNFELPSWKKILKTQKYFENYLNESLYYYPLIILNNIDKNKLIDFIDNYLELWNNDKIKLDNRNFYKKEKQLELITLYIKQLLNDYSCNNLIINLERLYNSTYLTPTFWLLEIENYSVDVLISLIYLENIEVVKLKEIKLWDNFEKINFIVDINEGKLNSNNKVETWMNHLQNNIINDFLIKIEKFQKLSNKWLLKIKDEIDLLKELKSYNFWKLWEIITDEISFLTIEKFQTPPTWSQYTTRKRIDEPIYTNKVSNQLLEWYELLKEVIHENDKINTSVDLNIIEEKIELNKKNNDNIFQEQFKNNNIDYSQCILDNIDNLFILNLVYLIYEKDKRINHYDRLNEYQKNNWNKFKQDLEKIREQRILNWEKIEKTYKEKYWENFESSNSLYHYLWNKAFYFFWKSLDLNLINNLYVEIEDVADSDIFWDILPKLIKNIEVKRWEYIISEIWFKYLNNTRYIINNYYSINIDNILKYFDEYFKKWINNELKNREWNYLLVSKQINEFIKYLKYEELLYWNKNIIIDNLIIDDILWLKKLPFDEHMLLIDISNNIDLLWCLLYFNYKWYIKITEIFPKFEKIRFDIIKYPVLFDNEIIWVKDENITLIWKNLNLVNIAKQNFVTRVNENIFLVIEDKLWQLNYDKLVVEICKKLPFDSQNNDIRYRNYLWTWLNWYSYKWLNYLTNNDYEYTIKILNILSLLKLDLYNFNLEDLISQCYNDTLNFDWFELREWLNHGFKEEQESQRILFKKELEEKTIEMRKKAQEFAEKKVQEERQKVELEMKDMAFRLLNAEDKEVIFSFKKINQKLYIKYRDEKEFLIKEVNFDSDYEIVANEMYNSETWIIENSKIKEDYKREISSLSDIKKILGFNNILRRLFFDWANKNKINFIKNINLERLENKNINELDVLKYLEDRYK